MWKLPRNWIEKHLFYFSLIFSITHFKASVNSQALSLSNNLLIIGTALDVDQFVL
jgi:hypothetical protein